MNLLTFCVVWTGGAAKELVSVHPLEDTLQTAWFFMTELLAAGELNRKLPDPVGRSMSIWQKRSIRQRLPRGAPCSLQMRTCWGPSRMTLVWTRTSTQTDICTCSSAQQYFRLETTTRHRRSAASGRTSTRGVFAVEQALASGHHADDRTCRETSARPSGC